MRPHEALDTLDLAVDRILERCGAHVVAAAPLGLGKPNRLLNALYGRVKAAPDLRLTLYTALSLARPPCKPGLEGRFTAPFVARHFGADYPELEYVMDLRAGTLPERIRIHEFYLQSASMLGNLRAQADYVSLNYTHVAREIARRGVNLILQQVARRGERLSLSCNADTTLDLIDEIRRTGAPMPYRVAVVHPGLPFLGNDAELPCAAFDAVLEEPGNTHRLFALPHEPVLPPEFALGLNASTLVRDGGTLQIGIGALSDALVYGLLLRHQANADWRQALAALPGGGFGPLAACIGGDAPFSRGLYGASEMVMDGFMHLRRAGILTRTVYDHLGLQRLLNEGRIATTADAGTLDRLIEAGVVASPLDAPSLEFLIDFGLVPAGTRLAAGEIHHADGTRSSADLHQTEARHQLATRIAGRRLAGGRYLHGAFWLGTRALIEWLGNLEGDDYAGLCMTRVSWINQLYGGREALDIAQRHQARFFNTCMMATLTGAAVSDGLGDGQVVSGVGGQYNFVAMAHAIPDGRSVLMLRATRESGGTLRSNIVWNHGHVTIPRHLRDVVVTEYGVADLRGASDEETITRMIAIADARFQDELLATARRAGKVRPAFRIPDAWRRNTPQAIADALAPQRAAGRFASFPFGHDFDADEFRLLPALKWLKSRTATRAGRLALLARAPFAGRGTADDAPLLARLGLASPSGLEAQLLRGLVVQALHAVRTPAHAGAGGRA